MFWHQLWNAGIINIYMYHNILNDSLYYIISRNRNQGSLQHSQNELGQDIKEASQNLKKDKNTFEKNPRLWQNESVSTETPVYCSSEKCSLLTKGDFSSLVIRISHHYNYTNIQLFFSQLWKDGTFAFGVGVAVGVSHLLRLLQFYLTGTTDQNHAALNQYCWTFSQTVQMDFSSSSGCSSVTTTTLCHWATIWSRCGTSLSWSSVPKLQHNQAWFVFLWAAAS